MKKILPRIMACLLAVLIAVNLVAVPKAEASLLASVGWSCALSAYLNGIGLTMDATCDAAEDIAYDVREWHENTIMPIWEKYEKAIDTTFDYATLIANGVNMSVTKQVRFSPELCSIFSEFAAWLISEFGLIGEDGEPVLDPVPVVPGVGDFHIYSFSGEDLILPDINTVWTDERKTMYPYAVIDGVNEWLYFYSAKPYCNDTGYVLFQKGSGYECHIKDNSWSLYRSYTDNNLSVNYAQNLAWCSTDIYDEYGSTLCFSAYEPEALEDWDNPILSAVLSPSYAGAPDVAEGEEVVIALPADSDISTWDDFRTYVAQQDLEGVYTPEAVTVEDAQAGAGAEEGTEEEDTATILGTVQNIWQSVLELPQSIAEAIKGLFVPDAALTAEITNTFSEKFSFVSDLHRLGTDLLNLEPYTEPPVVYIHLEDAEGTINYGGTVKALDMSWYERYKSDGDRIIGGFLWLGFLWACFMRTADIINGAGMIYATFPEQGPSINLEYDDTPRLPAPRKRPRGRVR